MIEDDKIVLVDYKTDRVKKRKGGRAGAHKKI